MRIRNIPARLKMLAIALIGSVLFPPALVLADDHTDWRERMKPISPRGYVCWHAKAPIKVDGLLDDAAWANAPWTDDFVDILGDARPKPRFRTRAKLLWDDDYLYVAAELEEPHVWATLTNHDSVIFNDPDFEMFIDPRGETQPYYEFEMNALNTTWDLRLNKPYQDGGKPDDAWEIPGARTAVHIDGTLSHPADTDRGWTVEFAFPWKALAGDARHAGPPGEGEQWRINFSRVEWQIATTNGAYVKVPKTPEDNWVWSPQGVVDMHRPEMWGIVQFTSKPENETISVAATPGKAARDLALEVYYAQRDFWSARKRWATNLTELKLSTDPLPPGMEMPALQPTADGYACSVVFKEGGRQRVWRIRQDRWLKLDEPMPVETEALRRAGRQKLRRRRPARGCRTIPAVVSLGHGFKITQITRAEVPELLKLIRELARFERLEHEMKATVASLRKALFGPQPVAGALLARCDGKAVGYAIYFSTFSSFIGRPGLWLEDLYVRPQFRQRGIGRRLIEAVAGVAAQRNCGRFEWTALNWNRNALEFYKRLGAKALDEWVLVRLDSRGLRRLAKGHYSTILSVKKEIKCSTKPSPKEREHRSFG